MKMTSDELQTLVQLAYNAVPNPNGTAARTYVQRLENDTG